MYETKEALKINDLIKILLFLIFDEYLIYYIHKK